MARLSVTTVKASLSGELAAATAPNADGDIIDAGPVILVVTAGAAPVTVTIQTTATDTGLDVEDAGGAVAASATRIFGPFPARLFAQASDAAVGPNRVLVDYGGLVDLTRRVVAL